MLSVFEQANFVDDKKIIKKYNHEIDEDGVKNMTDILHYIGTDPGEKKQIEDEQEAYRILDLAVKEKKDELIAEILKNKKAQEDTRKALESKDSALMDKDKALEDNRKTLEDKEKLIEDLKRKLDEKNGKP